MKKVRTVFMGTPKIAQTVLENMIQAGIEIVLVVTQPDKKVGRKQNIVFSPVKECAISHDIPVFQPVKISKDVQPVLEACPDLIVTCAFGQLVPSVILEAPKYGCVNLHGSLLPKYRGAAPIQRAIWNGETKSGMTLMKMVPAMDAGPIFSTQTVDILPTDTSSTLFEKMGLAASQLLLKNYDALCSTDATYTDQDISQVTYAPKILKEEEQIDLSKEDEQIYNQIRALAAEPGGYILVGKKKFKILNAEYIVCDVKDPMTWIKDKKFGFGLFLRHGLLVIHQCQMEGKPAVSGVDFANGQGQNLSKSSVL